MNSLVVGRTNNQQVRPLKAAEVWALYARFVRARVLTVPNALTALRLACLPAFVRLARHPQRRQSAALMLAALGATDALDGYIARRFDQVSALGRAADPVVDRAFVLTAMHAVWATGIVPPWFAWTVGAREVSAAAGAGIALTTGQAPLSVSRLGKAGAFAMMVAVPMFLLSSVPRWRRALPVAWVFAIGGQACAWAALAGYVKTFVDGGER